MLQKWNNKHYRGPFSIKEKQFSLFLFMLQQKMWQYIIMLFLSAFRLFFPYLDLFYYAEFMPKKREGMNTFSEKKFELLCIVASYIHWRLQNVYSARKTRYIENHYIVRMTSHVITNQKEGIVRQLELCIDEDNVLKWFWPNFTVPARKKRKKLSFLSYPA